VCPFAVTCINVLTREVVAGDGISIRRRCPAINSRVVLSSRELAGLLRAIFARMLVPQLWTLPTGTPSYP
jgi:hypothetical protein